MIYPAELIERWRGDEEILRAYGLAGPADILQKCREDLESWSQRAEAR